MRTIPDASRLTELGLDEPAVAAPRRRTATPAQQEASRRNGRRSRGPKSAAGRAVSSRNAHKHALLAKRLVPTADYRQLDALYWDIRAALTEEFKPDTFSSRAMVDALAHDYLTTVRARRLVDALVPVPSVSNEDQRRWEQMTRAQRDMSLLDAAIARLSTDGKLGLNLSDAKQLANLLGDSLIQATDDVAGVEERPASTNAATQDPELAQVERLVEALRPVGRQLADVDYLCEVLSGRRAIGRQERAALKVLTDYTRNAVQQWLEVHDGLPQRLAAAETAAIRPLAAAPEKLLLLNRYLTRTERAIAEKVRRLSQK